MNYKHKVLRIVILLAAVLPAVLLSSCTGDRDDTLPKDNSLSLAYDSVAYDHTAQPCLRLRSV